MGSILQYDAQKECLWFPLPCGKQAPYPCEARRGINGTIAVFPARYPMSLLGARVFKGIFPAGKATKSAIEIISGAKNIEAQIRSCAVVKGLEDRFRARPFAHQREAIEYMLHFDRLALLLEQGLGKTYISLMAIECLKRLGMPCKALVICPGIVFPGWIAETQKYTSLKILPYRGTPQEREAQRDSLEHGEWDIALTTFDMLIDRAQVTLAVYQSLWENMVEQSRRDYALLWLKNGFITDENFTFLTTPKSSKVWLSKCAALLRGLPASFLPITDYLEKIKESSNLGFLKKLPFNVLVVDEASRCLDPESRRSRAVETLSRKSEKTWLLSGTLCVGRPTDLFMPMNILSPDILGMDWQAFIKNFCCTAKTNRHIITGYKNIGVLKLRVDPHIIAKTRAECLDLPERLFMRRYYDLSDEMCQLYNKIAENEYITVGGEIVHTTTTLVKLAKCLQILNGFIYYDDQDSLCNNCDYLLDCLDAGISQGSRDCRITGAKKLKRKTFHLKTNPKLELLREDLADSEKEKVIIWAWHQEDIVAIKNLLKKEKIPFITADAENSAARFESSDNLRVFLGQTVQGIGITLNSATCTIYYSHGAALEPRLQSMDRNYRIGQKRSVVVKDYLSRGTVEESLVNLLAHKTDVKTFMQERVQCFACEKLASCRENKVPYLGKKCLYYGQRLSAEKIRRLKLLPVSVKYQ